MTSIEDLLKEHPFFRDLNASYIQSIARYGRSIEFAAQETVFREGEDANHFYIILQGKVAINLHGSHRGPITIQTIDSGDIFGWSWLIPPYKWRFNAKAVETTRAIVLDGKSLRAECEKDHRLGYELFKRIAQVISKRLEHARIQVLDVYCEKPLRKTKF
ncbi:MAG: cyclic nucleotide-binding domain-containing protein [Deltaproteobacteria bacterium]|nr:cyclic nucleotide-binding domain-containing protein [Deltaproteobacteria bacterium]MBW2153457.1 cyclic nucleotide-binding domain-containing protein [Deltaproteobacteria bacterium]